MWAHNPDFNTYAEEGEPWFGFEAVRGLDGLTPDLLLVPLFGHTLGHCGVAVHGPDVWLLHAGDAYIDPGEVTRPKRRRAALVGLFQMVVTTDLEARPRNQTRLRRFTTAHPEVRVFCAHNPWELEAEQHHATGSSPASETGPPIPSPRRLAGRQPTA